ncbi:hypothetical protein JMJ78_0007593, partial [Colletotrichum scovillei]
MNKHAQATVERNHREAYAYPYPYITWHHRNR